MKVNKLLRVFLAILVFIIACVILAVMDGENAYIQAPLELLRTGLDAFETSTVDDLSQIDLDSLTPHNQTQSPVMRCKCKLEVVRGANYMKQQFDVLLPWLNLTTRQDLPTHHPNLPVQFLYNSSTEKACHLVPTPFSIEWRNRHWQEVSIDQTNNKIILYSAVYDPNHAAGAPCLRLLGVSRVKDPRKAWCQIWYSPQEPPYVTRVAEIVHIDYQGKNSNRQMPYLLTCPLPPDPANTLPIPAAVSIVASPCTSATTLLKVLGAKEREPTAYANGKIPADPHNLRKGWVPAVCGPALYYYNQDFSSRLVEWLELLRAMGFGQVFLYMSDVHPNIEKVLQYYQQDGYIEVTDYAYPPPYINEPSIRRLWTLTERQKMFAQENIYFSDCLLRHMHQHRFITHFDPDEVPILPHHHNFTHFLDDILNRTAEWRSGYKLQWNFFYDDLPTRQETPPIPHYLWDLRHTRRLVKNLPTSPGKYKSIYDMDITRGVFSHGVLQCTTGPCSHTYMKVIPPTTAYLGHFSTGCGSKCKDPTREELWLHRFKEQVSKRVEGVLKELKLL